MKTVLITGTTCDYRREINLHAAWLIDVLVNTGKVRVVGASQAPPMAHVSKV